MVLMCECSDPCGFLPSSVFYPLCKRTCWSRKSGGSQAFILKCLQSVTYYSCAKAFFSYFSPSPVLRRPLSSTARSGCLVFNTNDDHVHPPHNTTPPPHPYNSAFKPTSCRTGASFHERRFGQCFSPELFPFPLSSICCPIRVHFFCPPLPPTPQQFRGAF